MSLRLLNHVCTHIHTHFYLLGEMKAIFCGQSRRMACPGFGKRHPRCHYYRYNFTLAKERHLNYIIMMTYSTDPTGLSCV